MYLLNKIVISSILVVLAAPVLAAIPNKIKLKSTVNIEQKSAGLREPSGLALSLGKDALWTVSDSTSKIFKIELNGALKANETIDIDGLYDQEGIAIGLDGHDLYTVSESDNAVIKVSLANKAITQKVYLKQIQGYTAMAAVLPYHFKGKVGANKGLEGITIHPKTGNIFILKESGLLVELSAKLDLIVNYFHLNFADDYSGICFEDADQNQVWIISDDSKKIYLFDLDTKEVKKSFELKRTDDSIYTSAEGVSYNPETKELYIVTDNKKKLRTYTVEYKADLTK